MLYTLPIELIHHIFSFLRDDARLPEYQQTFPLLHALMLKYPRDFFSLSHLYCFKYPYCILHAHTIQSPSLTLILAAKYNYTDPIPSLLKHAKCDPTHKKNLALHKAIIHNNTRVVELLLKDSRINPANYNNIAIGTAADNNRAEITQLLLADPRVDPLQDLRFYLYRAILNNNHNVCKILFADERIDPSMDDNRPLYDAAQLGHLKIVLLLVTNSRFEHTERYWDCICAAKNHGHATVLDILFKYNHPETYYDTLTYGDRTDYNWMVFWRRWC